MIDPEDRKQRVIKLMEELQPFDKFNNEYCPDIPQADEETYKNYVIPAFIRCGAIPKSELEDGATYYGYCRNADEAIWNAEDNCFVYQRHKFGFVYPEEINHFEDDDKYDLFVPLRKL